MISNAFSQLSSCQCLPLEDRSSSSERCGDQPVCNRLKLQFFLGGPWNKRQNHLIKVSEKLLGR